MSIDLYTLCPCGSGKKIKFCCRDLAGEIEKIERMIDAGQRKGCLEHVERLEKKYPGRTYLATTKARLLRELGEVDQAEQALRSVLEAEDQHNPVALAELALMAFNTQPLEEAVPAAIGRVQEAIEVCGDHDWPDEVLEALAAVANHAMAAGELMASLAHTELFLIANPEDEDAQRAMARFYTSEYVPLLHKEAMVLRPLPRENSEQGAFDAALKAAGLGHWRKAERALASLTEKLDAEPALWRNLAYLRGWLADRHGAAVALRKLATCDAPLEDAVEAEALAQLIDPVEEGELVDVVRVTYPVNDVDAVIAKVAAEARLVEAGDFQPADDQPPPRLTSLILDRAPPAADEQLAVEKMPVNQGRMMLYGKQTDREARVELLLARDEKFLAKKQAMGDVLGETVGPAGEDEVVGEFRKPTHRATDVWWCPPHVDRDAFQDLATLRRQEVMVRDWPTRPLQTLAGLSPQEAAKREELKVPLLAYLLNLELATNRSNVIQIDFNLVRKQLDLPTTDPIDPKDVELESMPLVRLARLRMDRVEGDHLWLVFRRASGSRALAAMKYAGDELLQRRDLLLQHRAAVAGLLWDLPEDTRQALAYVDMARQAAVADRRSSAEFDLQELSLRIQRGETEEVTRLYNHLVDEHINEPGVRAALGQLMVEVGLINPDGSLTEQALQGTQEAAVPPEEKRIWTPDAERAAQGAKSSEIWTP